MNYAELLSYWYLRLNGFFPITNFVLHQPSGSGQSSDCDVLGVRFPHVAEMIANDYENNLGWDEKFFKSCKIASEKDTVGIITQVKSGSYTVEEVKKSFNKNNLFYAVYRLGMFPREDVPGIVEALCEQPIVRRDKRVVAKLLIDTKEFFHPEANRKRENKVPWFRLPLEHVDEFITDRFLRYKNHKRTARMRFHDPLVQYLAWKALTGTTANSKGIQ